jgi:trimeric autotransporter adhesin
LGQRARGHPGREWRGQRGYRLQPGRAPFAYGSATLDNAFLGFAGNSTTTGTSNTASGVLALRNNSTGSFNTATGEGALAINSTGGGNTAIGFEALYFNVSGSSNTASGAGALEVNSSGSFNAATGGGALANNTTGGYNAAVGVEALYFNTTGSANTAVGEESLLYNATGSNNSALGFLAGPDSKSPNLSYATAIGAGAIVSESNALVLGGPLGSAAQVKVGIGTATPANVFTIAQGAGPAS